MFFWLDVWPVDVDAHVARLQTTAPLAQLADPNSPVEISIVLQPGTRK
jgi:hypothetical protein